MAFGKPSRERKSRPPRDRTPRAPRPLDGAQLHALGLAYVARFATSGAKLEDYLKRKLRERGWEGDAVPDLKALTARFVDLGYVDDEAFARARTGSLLRRGYGAGRIAQALNAAGIDEATRTEVRAADAALRTAALALARKRRLGPFGPEIADRAQREKQRAVLLRAGHPLDMARFLVDAGSVEAAEEWAAEGDDA